MPFLNCESQEIDVELRDYCGVASVAVLWLLLPLLLLQLLFMPLLATTFRWWFEPIIVLVSRL